VSDDVAVTGPERDSQLMTAEPAEVIRGGVDALVWVEAGRDDSEEYMGDSFIFNITVEGFGGSWQFGPDLIYCGGDSPGKAGLVYGPAVAVNIGPSVRRYWKVVCGHAAGGEPLTVSVYFTQGDLIGTWG
jgi:hypothetical protein